MLETLRKEVGESQLIILLFLQDKATRYVLEPLPDHYCLCFVIQFQPLHHLLHSEHILVTVVLGPPLPDLVQVTNMQQTVLSCVVTHVLRHALIVVEPPLHLLPLESDLCIRRNSGEGVRICLSPEYILLKSIQLGIIAFARDIVITDGIVGDDRGDWGRLGSDPALCELGN